jgi:CheY-like chemotaxis protein
MILNDLRSTSEVLMLDPSRYQVLIVEDDASVRTTLTLLLQASGYEVSTAVNGVEALELLKNGLPAVLISDLTMPGMSGLQLLSAVREQFPRLPLVAMSGSYETRDDVAGGMIADAFYAKGHGHPGVLLRILTEMISVPAVCGEEEPRQGKPLII